MSSQVALAMVDSSTPKRDKAYINTFIRDEAPKFHTGLGPKRTSDSDEELENISLGKKDSLKKLEAALKHFRERSVTPLDFEIDDCPWATVIEELQKAIHVRDTREKSKKGIGSHVWHSMGRSSKVIIPALESIPGEAGLSVLKGALAVIFSVARFKVENLDRILGAFEDVPAILREAEEIRDSHRNNGTFEKKLEVAIQELYSTLATGLKDLIRILTPKGDSANRITSVIKSYEIDRVTEDIHKCIERVRAVDRRLGYDCVAQTYSLQQDLNTQVTEMGRELRTKISASSDLNAGYASDVSGTVELVKEMRKDIKERATEASIVNLTTEIQEMKDMLRGLANEGLFLFLEEQLHQFRKNVPLDLAKRLESVRLDLASDEDVENLLTAIGPSPMDSVRDIERVLRKQSNIPSAAEQEARSLWRSSNFLRWLHSNEPEILFVTSTAVRAGRTSALSIVCATLAVQLLDEDYHPNFCIHFFCGEHTKPEDPLKGPEGMICALVAQLAVHLHSRGLLYTDASWCQKLQSGTENSRLEMLTYLFGQLAIQLPENSTLFCVLDGISQYQDDVFLTVMEKLRDNAFNGAVAAKIKFLLAGPTRFEPLVQHLDLQQWQLVRLNRSAGRGGDMLAPPLWTRRSSRRTNVME